MHQTIFILQITFSENSANMANSEAFGINNYFASAIYVSRDIPFMNLKIQ